ncbi:MAG: NYN domain-containing protein, partial [Coriobacteriales bacterium]|nr:NYN domain-containing protein [Coriobacteriales bacterium]
MPDYEHSLAVFIDYENLALGATPKGGGKRSPAIKPDIGKVLERLVEKGKLVAKRAYSDWQRFSDAVGDLHALGIDLTEIPDRGRTGKNSADIRLAVDAIELCHTKDYIDTFVIVSGDSDFTPLVSKLKENGKTVIG